MSSPMITSQRKQRVAVLFGGRSSEHSISCVSAASVLRAIDRSLYDVIPVGITEQGRWVLAPDDPDSMQIADGKLPRVASTHPAAILAGDPTGPALAIEDDDGLRLAFGGVDVVFPVLHGPYGEDGTIQGLLELADLPYVGSGVLSSAVSMDKHYMKIALAGAGLPVGPYVVISDHQWCSDPASARASVEKLGLPVFVKPARGGSSVGISKVKNLAEFDAAMALAREWDPKVIVEAMLEGREIECGVLEGVRAADGSPTAPEASVTAEIRVVGDHEFYDFEAKYLESSTELTVPAKIDPAVADEVRRLAVLAFEALSCEGLARVDFFVADGGAIVVNEVNTMPGFTPVSMFPTMWAATGVEYPALVNRLLKTALTRSRGLR
jgi:D-alanine-D-alanine ligase